MRKVLIIGAVGAGKSSLVRALLGDSQPAAKTQALDYRDWLIDTPGEYSENPLFYRSLMATSLEAGLLLLVMDSTAERVPFPPGFAQGFPINAVGVVTKIDLPEARCERATEELCKALPQGKVFYVSSETGEGIEQLRQHIATCV
ncbi:MAG: EutP/PduV family microcompartment system protein [Paenibacillaceae bacterium]